MDAVGLLVRWDAADALLISGRGLCGALSVRAINVKDALSVCVFAYLRTAMIKHCGGREWSRAPVCLVSQTARRPLGGIL